MKPNYQLNKALVNCLQIWIKENLLKVIDKSFSYHLLIITVRSIINVYTIYRVSIPPPFDAFEIIARILILFFEPLDSKPFYVPKFQRDAKNFNLNNYLRNAIR